MVVAAAAVAAVAVAAVKGREMLERRGRKAPARWKALANTLAVFE